MSHSPATHPSDPTTGRSADAARIADNGRSWRDWVGLAARLLLGGSLLVAGLLKIGNLDANVLSVRAYKLPFLSYQMEKVIGYAQPVVEIIVGLMIIIGLFTRVVALLGTLAMVVFIAGIISLWVRGLKIDCGCFSKGGATDNPHYLRDIIRDTVFALGGLWLLWRPRSPFSMDRWLFPPLFTRSHLDEHDDLDDDTTDPTDGQQPAREDLPR